MAKLPLRGIKEVSKNLNREIDAIVGRTLQGLIEASILIQRESEPMVPIDSGNLRSSWFTVDNHSSVVSGGNPSFQGEGSSEMSSDHRIVIDKTKQMVVGNNPALAYGYTANYAALVHENVDANWKRPGATAKFLEKAIRINQNKILHIIKSKAKIQ